MTQQDQTQPAASPWLKLLIGGDILAARRRMRNAWIAGFAAASIGLAVTVMSYGAADPEGRALLAGGRWALAFLLAETALLAGLSWGLWRRRSRAAAAAMFLYFLASKALAYGMGWGNMTALPVQIILGYLMFQGMRGAYTYHHLTHPAYPGAGATSTNTQGQV